MGNKFEELRNKVLRSAYELAYEIEKCILISPRSKIELLKLSILRQKILYDDNISEIKDKFRRFMRRLWVFMNRDIRHWLLI